MWKNNNSTWVWKNITLSKWQNFHFCQTIPFLSLLMWHQGQKQLEFCSGRALTSMTWLVTDGPTNASTQSCHPTTWKSASVFLVITLGFFLKCWQSNDSILTNRCATTKCTVRKSTTQLSTDSQHACVSTHSAFLKLFRLQSYCTHRYHFVQLEVGK